jgi:hypothetical protein
MVCCGDTGGGRSVRDPLEDEPSKLRRVGGTQWEH